MPKISRSTKRKEAHIKRPMNCFMIWSQPVRAKLTKETDLHNSEISKILGAMWRKLPDSEQKPFKDLANKLKEQHEADHPNYRFCPIRRKNKKHNRSSSSESEDQVNEEASAAISMPLIPPTPRYCSTSLSPGSSNPNAYHPNGYQAVQGQYGYYGMAHGVPQMMTHYPLSANMLDNNQPTTSYGQFQAPGYGSNVSPASNYYQNQASTSMYEGVFPSSMYHQFPSSSSTLQTNSPVRSPGTQQMQLTPPIYGQGATYPVNPPAQHVPMALTNYAQGPTTVITTPTVSPPAQQVQMAPSSYPQGETNWGATPMVGNPQVAVSAVPSPNDQSTTVQFTQLQNRPYTTSEMVGNGINGGQSYYGGAHDNYYYPSNTQ